MSTEFTLICMLYISQLNPGINHGEFEALFLLCLRFVTTVKFRTNSLKAAHTGVSSGVIAHAQRGLRVLRARTWLRLRVIAHAQSCLLNS